MIFTRFLGFIAATGPYLTTGRQTNVCKVPANEDGSDDSPAILEAFDSCGQGGTIVFSNTTYHVERVLNTTGLNDCRVELKGTLLFGTDFEYWIGNSLTVPGYDDNGYQNMSSAWHFGGKNVVWEGFGYGTIDGNGQAWYDFVDGENNYPGRPHGITIFAEDSTFKGLRFVQSQMWTMTIHSSKNVLMQDIYVASTSNGSSTINTDGADTMFSDNVHFDRWHVRNGDDCIALKANSTNIQVTNSEFHDGIGIAIGSIGQYAGRTEIAEDFYADNNVFHNTLHALFMKTWTGESVGYPPNGGGGGLGYLKNFTMVNTIMDEVRGVPFVITQCMTMQDDAGGCNTSTMEISDLLIANMTGTMTREDDHVVSLGCSAAAPCSNIDFTFDIKGPAGNKADWYTCSNAEEYTGFECDAPACEKPTADGTC